MSDIPEHLLRPPGPVLHPVLRQPPPLLDISKVNGTPWVNPTFDTTDPNWSSNVVQGQTFDGSPAHKFEWVSVLNPDVEQDDEVGLAGTAVSPDVSGQTPSGTPSPASATPPWQDLYFTHPFGPDWEFTIVPDPAYTNLLGAANKDQTDLATYGKEWAAAVAAGISVPSGLLGVEIDESLVPPAYRAEQGDRVAVYGRWIVDAGHKGFHTEIHPPLLMARAQSVDGNGNKTARSAEATTSFQLWSRPYQSGQLYSSGGNSGLALHDYVVDIVSTARTISAYPPVFTKPFQGIHIVSFTVRPPVDIPAPKNTGLESTAMTPHLECSYHFTVNGSCGVEVMQSPAEPDSVLVVLALNSAGYPALPAPPRHTVPVGLQQLISAAPSGIDLTWLDKLWATIKDIEGEGNIIFDICNAPQMSQTQDQVNVVPFTPLGQLPKSSQATDNNQPFPVYGWLKLRWVTPTMTKANPGQTATTTA